MGSGESGGSEKDAETGLLLGNRFDQRLVVKKSLCSCVSIFGGWTAGSKEEHTSKKREGGWERDLSSTYCVPTMMAALLWQRKLTVRTIYLPTTCLISHTLFAFLGDEDADKGGIFSLV